MYHIVNRTHNGSAGVLAGFAPDVWQINNEPIYQYKKCCANPTNWQAVGDIKLMGGSWYGWTHYADGARCSVCGHSINAGFYCTGESEAQP